MTRFAGAKIKACLQVFRISSRPDGSALYCCGRSLTACTRDQQAQEDQGPEMQNLAVSFAHLHICHQGCAWAETSAALAGS